MSVKVIPISQAYRDNWGRTFGGQGRHASAICDVSSGKRTPAATNEVGVEMEEYEARMMGPVVWLEGDCTGEKTTWGG